MSFDKRIFNGIAHRGLHDDKYPENSLGAFNNAISKDLAFECDVHLTLDDELIIMHDENLKRMTGIEGEIEALPFKHIRKHYKLPDGSDIPTLKEVLDLNKERVPMLIELKVPQGGGGSLAKAVAKKVSALLDATIKNPELITLISFDPRALTASSKKYEKGLLVANKTPWTLMFRHMFNMLDVEKELLDKKSVQKFPKKGKILNCFTIDSEEDLRLYAPVVTTLTYENIDPEAVKKTLTSK